MTHNKQELTMIKDALVEHWHNSMRHAKDSAFKEICRCLMEDYKVLAAKAKQK